MIFTRLHKASGRSSAIAMALVLATGGTLVATALEAPAFAQKKKKKKKGDEQQEYSREFLEAYAPIQEKLQAETPDPAGAKPLLPPLIELTNSPQEKLVAGQVLVNVGNNTDDEAMLLRGYEMMVASGKTDANTTGQLNQALYQAYRDQGNLEKAKAAIEANIAAGYSFQANMSDGSVRNIGGDDMRLMVSELYFDQDRVAEGLAYLKPFITAKQEAGEPVNEQWLRRGFTVAYGADLKAETLEIIAALAQSYPSPEVWGDAVEITLFLGNYGNAANLDLLRLSRRMENYKNTRLLSEYVELLDARRYPGEVVAVIDEGQALGVADMSDSWLVETRREAAGRVNTDKAGLPGLAREARAANADGKTLVVAGDTFLSYDQPAEAEEFYTAALSKPGVETAMVLTRLGIAQFDQGKYAEASETFGKVEGVRSDIARLWAVYAAQKQAPAAETTAEATM